MKTNQAYLDYYRCPQKFADFTSAGALSSDTGYFLFGTDAVCYGRSTCGFRAPRPTGTLFDTFDEVQLEGTTCCLPFDPTEAIDNLRYERYVAHLQNGTRLAPNRSVKQAYYLVRPLMPVWMRKHFQRIHLSDWSQIHFPHWPVDRTVERILEKLLMLSLRAHNADKIPFIWFWPNGAPSCAIITHDVETSAGRDFCPSLMDLDDSYAVKASFQIVPEKRYRFSEDLLDKIRARGFEIVVQDLNHDGHLFSSREQFLARAKQINEYAQQYRAAGFRSAILYRNQDWYDALQFSYDMSVPNAAHLEPQRGGCCTVMPYFVNHILELPVTTTQDYSLFHIIGDYSIEVWKSQIDLITEKHGLVSFIIHPDYIIERRARKTYRELLAYLSQLRSEKRIWIALPREVNDWWRERSQMKLVEEKGRWRIEGSGKERASVAYARLQGDRIIYSHEEQQG